MVKRRVKVTLNCVADTYVDKGRERVVEFSDPGLDPGDGSGPPGGLISFRRSDDGFLDVELYRLDDQVRVKVPRATGADL